MSGFTGWPGENNGREGTSGYEPVETPADCPVCDEPVTSDLPNHLRYECEGKP